MCVTPTTPCQDSFDCLETEFCEPTLGKCLPQVGATSHLFVLPLDASGLPKNGVKAQPIFPNDGNNQVSPSLSPDRCTVVRIPML